MTRHEKHLLTDRDRTLDAALLTIEGVYLNPDRTALRDATGDWWPIAWSSHLNRYESPIAHVDAVLRRASRWAGD
jgi:hypothetical protein